MLQGAVVAILGPHVARGLLFPLAYLAFLVPFGEALEGPLQTVTVAITMPLLHLFGVPASVDGVLITIPNGYFEVAEACSGAKFVIAMIAYGTLVANVCYVSWGRRAADRRRDHERPGCVAGSTRRANQHNPSSPPDENISLYRNSDLRY